MHLLYIDRDRSVARALHGELLSYRGINWNLTHCEDYRQASRLLESDDFQTVLLRAEESADSLATHIKSLLESPACPPIVAVTGDLRAEEHLRLIASGSEDSINRLDTNGHRIMRQLRLAELRRAKWSRQSSDADAERAIQFIDGVDQHQILNHETGNLLKHGDESDALSIESRHGMPAELVRKTQLRVAHVAASGPLLEIDSEAHGKIDFEGFQSLSDVIDRLDDDPYAFDALLIEQSIFEETLDGAMLKLERFLPLIPSVVLTLEKSDFAALSYIERGFCECLVAQDHSLYSIEHVLRKSVWLRRRMLLERVSQARVGGNVSDRRKSVRFTSNRRRHVRFMMERPAIAIPVLPNGAPDLAGRRNATTVDISLGGIGLSMPSDGQLPSRNWVVGIEQFAGSIGFVNAYLRRAVDREGSMQVGLIFQNEAEDFFSDSNLRPEINGDTKRFEARVGGSILQQWSHLGVLGERLTRRVKVCPECEAVCTVGTGCYQCGGFNISFQDLIHHFACAHVGLSRSFERDDGVECPKCLRGGLVVGADFEVIRSRYQCNDCSHNGDVVAQVGNCLKCSLRFPIEMANEIDVYDYHLDRLDILALVDSAR